MPKSKQLTEFERGEIVGLKKANFSIRKIAEILKCSKTAVENTINDYFKKNKTTAVPRSGRPKKLSDHDNRQIITVAGHCRSSVIHYNGYTQKNFVIDFKK